MRTVQDIFNEEEQSLISAVINRNIAEVQKAEENLKMLGYTNAEISTIHKSAKSPAASYALELMDNDCGYMKAVEMSVARYPESAATICEELELYI
jgi:hypothetical protein